MNCICGGYDCKICGINRGVCVHLKRSRECYQCMKSPIIYTCQRILKCSRSSDKKRGFDIDVNNYIDLNYILQEIITSNTCPYCHVRMQITGRCPSQMTIERIQNNLPHTKENTILCCLQCNLKKVGQR